MLPNNLHGLRRNIAYCVRRVPLKILAITRDALAVHALRATHYVFLTLLLTGCGSIFGPSEPEPTATPAAIPLVPTFTSTPVVQATSTLQQVVVAPTPTPTAEIAAAAPLTQTESSSPTTAQTEVISATNTPAPAANSEPRLIVDAEGINVRSGPGTEYDLAGAATQGESFTLLAKNAAGDWWQVCCVNGQQVWVYGPLARVENGEAVAVAIDIPPPPTVAPVAEQSAPAEPAPAAEEPAAPAQPAAPYDPTASSAGNFDPNAQYQVVNLRVLGLDENNGGIRSPQSLHYILITVLDANGNGVDGAVVRNLVGEKGEVVTGGKGPGKAEITMFYEPFKLTVVSDPSGPVTSQVSNQMGLAFPHLPDIVGKLGDENYEYGVCPTLEIKCQWPIQAVHFSYEITFQKVR